LLPVIRYFLLNAAPSLSGDDEVIAFGYYYQIDLFTHLQDEYSDAMKKEIVEMCKANKYKILNIRSEEEGIAERTIYEIKIEE
jgi:hypothetical protein